MKTRKIKQIIMAVVALMALLPMRSMAASATLSIEDFTIKGGETKTMLIDVNNADMQVTLVQFDMRLPQGLSVAMKDGDYAIDIAGRTTYKKHSVSVNLIDGLLRVMLHSSNREVLSGTSGAVLGVTLTAASGFSSGKIQLENIKIVAPDANATTSKPGTYIYNVSDAVTLTAKSYTRQYGEANPTFGYEVTSGTITSGTPTITCSATATSPVGTYDIVIAKGSVTNGTVNLVKGTLTITKAPLTISAGSYTKVEGEANPTFTPTFSGFKNGETKNVLTKQPTITCTATTASTPGSYPVTVSGAEAQNYSISYVNGTLTVTVKVVPEPYIVFSIDRAYVTFYYDGNKASRGGVDINISDISSGSSSPYRFALTAIIDASFADYRPTSTAYWFQRCSFNKILGIKNLNTENVTDMSNMFSGCYSLTSLDLSSFKTDKVTNMAQMFDGCRSLTSLDLSGFNTDNVTNMNGMFSKCSSLTSLDVNGFKTDKVKDMGGMFSGCYGLTSLDLSGFNTDNVTSMTEMFSGCYSLKTIYVCEENWSTVNVTSGNDMFSSCNSILGGYGTKYDSKHVSVEYARIDNKPDIPGYLTYASLSTNSVPYVVLSNGKVTFYYDSNKVSRGGIEINNRNIDPTYRDVKSAIIDASFADYLPASTTYWFNNCSSLISITGIENLHTENLTDMCYMFYGCSKLTSLDLSGLKTDNVTDMCYMFYKCSSLTSLDLSGFNTDNVTNMNGMFSNCSGLTSLNLSGFNTDNVTNMNGMFSNCSGLTSLDLSGFNTDNVTSMENMFSNCSGLTSLDLSGFNTDNVTSMSNMFSGCSSLTCLDLSGFNTDNVTSMSNMFSNCSKLTSLNLSGFKTDNVTDMHGMFSNCSKLTSLDVSDFKTDNVTDMSFMFSGCSSLTSLDVSGFNTSNVTNMGGMFSNCSKLTSLDLSGFKTDNVMNMYQMFCNCSNLTSLNLNGWSNGNVRMEDMFYGCSSLTSLDLSGFKTDSVWNMGRMFCGCSSLTSLDLSDFKTNNVKYMEYMFYGCSSLKTIYVSEENWSTANVTIGNNMFNGCTSLIGGNGTKYDASHVGVEYACIDKEGQPGYLTEKSKSLTPSSGEEEVYGSDDDGQYDDLDGNVIGNILYSIDPTDGGYNKSEGCIEVTKPTSDDDLDAIAGKDPFGEDVRNNFTGIIFMVSAGKGTIKVNAETTGGMLLKVKIGNDEPTEMELDGKLKATFHYNVTKPTYVYIYASYSGAASARGNGEEPSLKIYGIEWKQDAGTPTGVDSLTTNPSPKDEGSVYTLGGQRIDALPKKKGVYIRGGKKFVR